METEAGKVGYYVFLGAYEKDGVTLKEDRQGMPYEGFRGMILQEVRPIELGHCVHMILSRRPQHVEQNGAFGRFDTTAVQKVDQDGDLLAVTTKNTIYKFTVLPRQ